jgi:hypothetical protein
LLSPSILLAAYNQQSCALINLFKDLSQHECDNYNLMCENQRLVYERNALEIRLRILTETTQSEKSARTEVEIETKETVPDSVKVHELPAIPLKKSNSMPYLMAQAVSIIKRGGEELLYTKHQLGFLIENIGAYNVKLRQALDALPDNSLLSTGKAFSLRRKQSAMETVLGVATEASVSVESFLMTRESLIGGCFVGLGQ